MLVCWFKKCFNDLHSPFIRRTQIFPLLSTMSVNYVCEHSVYKKSRFLLCFFSPHGSTVRMHHLCMWLLCVAHRSGTLIGSLNAIYSRSEIICTEWDGARMIQSTEFFLFRNSSQVVQLWLPSCLSGHSHMAYQEVKMLPCRLRPRKHQQMNLIHSSLPCSVWFVLLSVSALWDSCLSLYSWGLSYEPWPRWSSRWKVVTANKQAWNNQKKMSGGRNV